MIKEFVEAWDERKDQVREEFSKRHPEDYQDIVETVIRALVNVDGYGGPDPNNIVRVDQGDYQGTLVFLIPEATYQPHEYWYVRVWYGSCSGCDTLLSIKGWTQEEPTEDQTDKYMTLALHVVQRMKAMDEEVV